MSENKRTILWIDDEIELLKAHIILLQQRGYDVDTCTNGSDAVELVKQKNYQLIFLDEMMVGMTGLETLAQIKEFDVNVPVVMVTKNEEESLMEEAIGWKISDYLTKPVNPAQIILVCKKFFDADKINKEKFTHDYLTGFTQLSLILNTPLNWIKWEEIYRNLTSWSMNIDKLEDDVLKETLAGKWSECNKEFSRFVENNYENWINHPDNNRDENNPIMSPHILDQYLLPILNEQNENIYFIVIDCLRYDQWLVMQELLYPFFSFKKNDLYCSILPTATPYARNAIFAGLYPIEIKNNYPKFWNVDTNSEDNRQNHYEKDLLEAWLTRKHLPHNDKMSFIKIFDTDFGKKIEKEFDKYLNNNLTTIVINAVDMIAHSRSDHAILKEIAPDEAAYRSLTKSWFTYSSLFGILKIISQQKNAKVVITTDHGAIRCLRGIKVLGDKDTSTNLRYKFGKNVNTDSKSAVHLKDLQDYKLPKMGLTVNNLIAKEDYYFVYPTDFHHYMAKFRDSFQHGGISLEEMFIPVIELESK